MMVMLLVDTILYTVLFVYLDMVLPVGPGVKHALLLEAELLGGG